MTLGPVQVLVVGVDGPGAAETVRASVTALDADGPVRCLDAFAVVVADDGAIDVDEPQSRTVALFAREAADDDAGGTDATWSLADAVPVGGRAVVVLLEHRWALGLRDQMLAAGAALLDETWLDEQDREELEGLLGR